MDFGSAFSYVTQDEDWIKKIAIGAVLVLIGIGMVPLAGWMMKIIRRVEQGDPELLPDWDDFGTLIMDGLKLIAVFIVWVIPLAIISGCLSLIGVIGADAFRESTAIVSLSSFLSLCVAIPYGLVLFVLSPAMIGHLAVSGSMGEAINPATAFKLVRANFGGYLLVAIVASIISSAFASLGLIVCIIGTFPATAYAMAVNGNLYGQAYRESLARGALEAA